MRLTILALAAAGLLCGAPAAMAAPTCWNATGETVRCGTPGALPVGTRLTADQAAERSTRPADLSFGRFVALACVIGGIFALIALMPEFERWEK